jgi:hypothetical protein
MVGSMQHSAPEYPDSLAFDVEERNGLHPPRFLLLGKEVKPVVNELNETITSGFYRKE